MTWHRAWRTINRRDTEPVSFRLHLSGSLVMQPLAQRCGWRSDAELNVPVASGALTGSSMTRSRSRFPGGETTMSTTTAIAATTTNTTKPTYTVSKPGHVPIKSWVHSLDATTMEQATNLSNLPFAIRHVALMPCAHAGYGMPIGGVLFAEKAVVPYSIGVDIDCGVALAETDLTTATLWRDELDRTLAEIARRVPTGMSSQPAKVDKAAALAEIGLPCPSRSSRHGSTAPSTSSERWAQVTKSWSSRLT